MSNIRIKQYEQTADEKVSLNGIKWLRKWDVCVQCDSAEEAEALRARLAQPEPTNRFNPDWDAIPVMVEEQQRMAKRIEELETQLGEAMWGYGEWRRKAEALEQEKQTPVAWISCNAGLYHGKPDESLKPLPLYTASSQREWVGLTDEEYETMAEQYVTNCYFDTLKYAKAIEAKLKEKNT